MENARAYTHVNLDLPAYGRQAAAVRKTTEDPPALTKRARRDRAKYVRCITHWTFINQIPSPPSSKDPQDPSPRIPPPGIPQRSPRDPSGSPQRFSPRAPPRDSPPGTPSDAPAIPRDPPETPRRSPGTPGTSRDPQGPGIFSDMNQSRRGGGFPNRTYTVAVWKETQQDARREARSVKLSLRPAPAHNAQSSDRKIISYFSQVRLSTYLFVRHIGVAIPILHIYI